MNKFLKQRKLTLTNIFLLTLTLSFTAFSCAQDKPQANPPGYDLADPERFKMPDALQEISGFAFHNGDAKTVYAQQDEDGKVFKMPFGTKEDKPTKFGKKGDYEDMAIVQNKVIVLKSDGDFFVFPLTDMAKEETTNVKLTENIIPKGEYEGLYANEQGEVFVLCKKCDQDKKKQATIYTLTLLADGSLKNKGTLTVDASELDKLSKKKKGSFHPSGLSRHPLTKDWYIISSVNKALLIYDSNWKIKSVHHLNSNEFNQPEGIAFDTAGNLYISNEGSETTLGNILKFAYKK